MEQKYYQIDTKTPEDWQVVHKLLMEDGTLDDNIPCRSCDCADDILHSKTRSTYLMTDEEAEILRNDPRIESVCLDSRYYPELEPKKVLDILRFGKNVRNYRALRKFNGSSDVFSIPQTNPSSAELNRTGYQILRCTQKDNPYSSDSSAVVSRDINYNYDGSDVDVIVVDDAIWVGHPEFVSDEYDPPNYVRGNVLSRSGLSGVLDLALDAPYYLDPDWFDADPTNRLTRRWDGTVVPTELYALRWWKAEGSRSASFPKFGSIDIDSGYTRGNYNGSVSDRLAPPFSGDIVGTHGTPCASLAYGKNFGWAFNANKWFLSFRAITSQTLFDIQKIFHAYKPVHPKFGTRNPTVSSNSWSESPASRDSNYLTSNQPRWEYRNGAYSGQITNSSSIPNFVKTAAGLSNQTYKIPTYIPYSRSDLNSGREMVDAGVIFVTSAGNEGRFVASPGSPFFNNKLIYSNGYVEYTNRPGFPAQIGFREGQDSQYRTVVVGAIDDEYVGAYSNPSENDSYYLSNAIPGQERIARNEEQYPSYFGTDYSNKGSGIDVYAPGDGVLSAQGSISPIISPDTFENRVSFENPTPYPISSSDAFYDRWFNGTSAACPVVAGIIAGLLQNNRSWTISAVKDYLRNNIDVASNFWNGPSPGDQNDSAWLIPFSCMGSRIRLIREQYVFPSTFNESFTPTYGIGSGSGFNETFLVSESSAIFHSIEIYGIKKFQENDGTVNLNVENGIYKVGAKTTTDANRYRDITLRIDPTNQKRLQLSDNDGQDSWNNMVITVTNGYFVYSSTEIYYVFAGISPPPSPPIVTGPLPGFGEKDYEAALSQGFSDEDIRYYLEQVWTGRIGPAMINRLNDGGWGTNGSRNLFYDWYVDGVLVKTTQGNATSQVPGFNGQGIYLDMSDYPLGSRVSVEFRVSQESGTYHRIRIPDLETINGGVNARFLRDGYIEENLPNTSTPWGNHYLLLEGGRIYGPITSNSLGSGFLAVASEIGQGGDQTLLLNDSGPGPVSNIDDMIININKGFFKTYVNPADGGTLTATVNGVTFPINQPPRTKHFSTLSLTSSVAKSSSVYCKIRQENISGDLKPPPVDSRTSTLTVTNPECVGWDDSRKPGEQIRVVTAAGFKPNIGNVWYGPWLFGTDDFFDTCYFYFDIEIKDVYPRAVAADTDKPFSALFQCRIRGQGGSSATALTTYKILEWNGNSRFDNENNKQTLRFNSDDFNGQDVIGYGDNGRILFSRKNDNAPGNRVAWNLGAPGRGKIALDILFLDVKRKEDGRTINSFLAVNTSSNDNILEYGRRFDQYEEVY